MPCNGYRHTDCNCGWGGVNHGSPTAEMPQTGTGATWQSADLCRPTTCRRCGADVFFVRHNGGSVWLDKLGWPWPKHGCFAGDQEGIQLRWLFPEPDETGPVYVFGVIIEAVKKGQWCRLTVRCSDGSVIDRDFSVLIDLALLPGRLVRVTYADKGGISLHFLYPAGMQTRACWGLIDNHTRQLVEQFDYAYPSTVAERRLRQLNGQHPGRYRLGVVFRPSDISVPPPRPDFCSAKTRDLLKKLFQKAGMS